MEEKSMCLSIKKIFNYKDVYWGIACNSEILEVSWMSIQWHTMQPLKIMLQKNALKLKKVFATNILLCE